MKFTYFEFKNFKGITDQKIDLSKNPNSKVFTLVGLNESGKTTILEAINFFAYKPESLEPLELDNYKIEDIHSLIPISQRDNFNDYIVIKAGIEMDESDVDELEKEFYNETKLHIKFDSHQIVYTQLYSFKASVHNKDKDQRTFQIICKTKKPKGKNFTDLTKEQSKIIHRIILNKIPSILYFPNFLFEFPERIYLEEFSGDLKLKHQFYQTIIQDVLDSLNNELNIDNHLIKRIKSKDPNEKRNLMSVLRKMESKLTEVIFDRWNQIFNKQITKTEVTLSCDIEEENERAYIDFYIKDNVDTYKISERSLGFRWFFVYILLTQFRCFRKKNKDVFFLFDEPASNLHPSAQQELLKSFDKLDKVIYTTHSHHLINPKWLENTFVIKNEAIDYDKEEEFKPKNTDIKITKYREFAVKHPNQISYFQPILEVLDYRPSSIELVPKAIITEGKNDFYILNYFQKIIFHFEKSISIIPGTSSSNLDTLISLYFGWGKDFLVLLDSDDEGKKQKEKYIEEFGKSLEGKIITLDQINSKWINIEIEDLFDEKERLVIQKINYPDEVHFNKKLFNRSMQELYINSEKTTFEKQTEVNFSQLLKYCSEKLEQTQNHNPPHPPLEAKEQKERHPL